MKTHKLTTTTTTRRRTVVSADRKPITEAPVAAEHPPARPRSNPITIAVQIRAVARRWSDRAARPASRRTALTAAAAAARDGKSRPIVAMETSISVRDGWTRGGRGLERPVPLSSRELSIRRRRPAGYVSVCLCVWARPSPDQTNAKGRRTWRGAERSKVYN